MRKSLIMLLIITPLLQAGAVTFEQANTAYRAKEFARAAELYGELIAQNGGNATLFYNLGNARFRRGELGGAILAYEKALKLDPADGDIRHNLAVANARLQDKVEPLPAIFVFRWWAAFIHLFTVNGWLLLAAVLTWLAAAAGTALFFLQHPALRRVVLLLLPVLLFALLLSASSVIGRVISESAGNEAVVLQKSVTVRSAPDESAKDAFIIHEGLKIRISDTLEEWLYITLPDGKTGWVKKQAVGLI